MANSSPKSSPAGNATGAKRKPARGKKPDEVLAQAVEVARDALEPIAYEDEIGEYIGCRREAERLVTHAFECLKEGYRGWHWVATLARVPRGRIATVCEIDLLPGEGALLAPDWIPWADRLEPSDITRRDVLPYVKDDPRLDESFEDADPKDHNRREIEELGLGRPRVLSDEGQRQAVQRWTASEQGPLRNSEDKRLLNLSSNTCSTCGFLIKLAGPMRTTFGVCANKWSPDDGRVVSLEHACGAHSETDVKNDNSAWKIAPLAMNEISLDPVNLQVKI